MRMSALILTVLVATLPMAPASPQEKPNPPRKEQIEELPPPPGLPPVKAQREEPAKTVKELQKERIATLEAAADMAADLYRMGGREKVSLDDVVEARLLVFKAALEAAEKDSDRITLYKKIVDFLKNTEAVANAKFQAQRTTSYPVLKLKARRLKAEIDLQRAKAKEAKEAK
jgi:hypothetical protein